MTNQKALYRTACLPDGPYPPVGAWVYGQGMARLTPWAGPAHTAALLPYAKGMYWTPSELWRGVTPVPYAPPAAHPLWVARRAVPTVPYDYCVDPLEQLAGEVIRRRRKYWPQDWTVERKRKIWIGGPQELAACGPYSPVLFGSHPPREYHKQWVDSSVGAAWLLARAIAAEARAKPEPAGYVVFVTRKRLQDACRDEYDVKAKGSPRTGLSNFDAAPQEVRSGSGREYVSKRPDRVVPLCVSPFPGPLQALLRDELRTRVRDLQDRFSMPTVRKHIRSQGREAWTTDDGPVSRQEPVVPSDASGEDGYRGPGTYRVPWHWQPGGAWTRVRRTVGGKYDKRAEYDYGQDRERSELDWMVRADLGTVLNPAHFDGWDPNERRERDTDRRARVPVLAGWDPHERGINSEGLV